MRAIHPESDVWAALPPPLPTHHHHPLSHGLSRRAFLGAAAGTTGVVLGAGLLTPAAAAASSGGATPRPIPKGTTVGGVTFSFQPFGPGLEPASITDFHGLVGVADVQGTGTATNHDGTTETLLYDTDMRFMKGAYIATDGRVHKGTFGFV
ncbi:MAG TPA: hypothetical protein VI316_03885 [Candidatus Dormibacteraeota bacterium]